MRIQFYSRACFASGELNSPYKSLYTSEIYNLFFHFILLWIWKGYPLLVSIIVCIGIFLCINKCLFFNIYFFSSKKAFTR